MEHATGGELGSVCLDLTQVLPGDILLTTSHGLPALVIRTLTHGDYSHVSLIVSSTTILEADDQGIRHKRLVCHRATGEVPVNQRVLSRLARSVTSAVVLRKPGFADMLGSKGIDLEAMTRPILSQVYAHFSALAETIHDAPLVKEAARAIGEAIDWAHHRDSEPGLFCSQMVASIYAAILGESLVSGLEPQQFSPNTFLSLGWNLVPDAITAIDEEKSAGEGGSLHPCPAND
jgi:hypothetical protein